MICYGVTMASSNQVKSARLEGRCTHEQKSTVEYAVKLSGSSMTDFMVNALMEKACLVIKEHNVLQLSKKDQEAFAAALLNPPKPNQALVKARNRHKKEIHTK